VVFITRVVVGAWADRRGTPGPTMHTLLDNYDYLNSGITATEGGIASIRLPEQSPEMRVFDRYILIALSCRARHAKRCKEGLIQYEAEAW